MSYKQYFKQANPQKGDAVAETEEQPLRFHEIQRIDRRRHQVLDYMLLQYSPEEISEFLGEELTTIERDIEEIIKIGYEVREEDITEVRDEIMRIYRLAARESYSAFKKSQGEVKTVTTEYGKNSKRDGDGAEDEPVTRKEKVEIQSGDARHMKNMIEAAKEMGKVSGAQKHKEVEVQQNVQNNQLNILSPDRTQMPEEFNRWTKKPDDAEIPDGANVDMENL